MHKGGNTKTKSLPNITNKNKFMLDILTGIPLSEMIESNGKLFRTEFITKEKLTKTTSRSRWPNQIKPSPSAWKLCKKIIMSTFKLTPNFILPIELRLSN